MQFENIRILAKKEELKLIKDIITKFEKIMPHLKFASKHIGELSDRIVVSIKIDVANYEKIVEILIMNGIKVLAGDDKTKNLIDKIKNKLKDVIEEEDYELENKAALTPISDDELTKLAKEGKYEEIRRLSKNIINFSENFIKTISDLLELAIKNAIEIEVNNVKKDKNNIEESLARLIKIASDLSIRTFNKNDLSIYAGFEAIKICEDNYKYFSYLIDIANKNNLPVIVNIQAVLKFVEMINNDFEFFKEEIEYAKKNLNIRWLDNIYEIVEATLSKDQILAYSNFLKYLIDQKK